MEGRVCCSMVGLRHLFGYCIVFQRLSRSASAHQYDIIVSCLRQYLAGHHRIMYGTMLGWSLFQVIFWSGLFGFFLDILLRHYAR